MARKRVTRKQLLKEPDEFLTLSSKIIQWAQANSRRLSWGLTIILLLAVVFSAMRFFSARAEAKSLALFDDNKSAYEKVLKNDGSPQKAYDQIKPSLETLIKQYGDKNGAKMATVFYANISYDAKHYDQAIELYQKALKHYNQEPVLKDLIVSSLANAYQSKKEYPSAINYFQQLANAPRTAMKDEALFNLAAIYGESGNTTAEREALQKIVSENEDSMYAPVAREKLATF